MYLATSILNPSILFFNINGSGLGHLNRCLAYARQVQTQARPYFFSLASAMEVIHSFGFEGDYFVSHFWSDNSTFAWNSELALRLGLVLEHIRPQVLVFDGPWPYQGFIKACRAYKGDLALVWSYRGLLKAEAQKPTVDPDFFDLVLRPGELGAVPKESILPGGTRELLVPPVCLLADHELYTRDQARQKLGLELDKKYALFSLGPGNIKDVTSIGHGLLHEFTQSGLTILWARPPIAVRDVELPAGVQPLSMYPLVRYLRAFDVFVGAAGYNTCCEVVQAGIPSLLVPNEHLADDQTKRAQMVAQHIPAVVSGCDTENKRHQAVAEILALVEQNTDTLIKPSLPMNGAQLAAKALLTLVFGVATG